MVFTNVAGTLVCLYVSGQPVDLRLKEDAVSRSVVQFLPGSFRLDRFDEVDGVFGGRPPLWF